MNSQAFFILQPPENLNKEILKAELDQRLQDSSLHVHIQEMATQDPGNGVDSGSRESFIIFAIGPDQKGLVARISRIIAEYNANITNLEAVFRGGDEPRDNIMSYEVFITDNIERRELFDVLQQKARELNLDIRIQLESRCSYWLKIPKRLPLLANYQPTSCSTENWAYLKSPNQLDQTFKGHYRVDHSQQEYVRGSASINGIEGF